MMGFFKTMSGWFVEETAKPEVVPPSKAAAARHTLLVIDDDSAYLETTTALLRDAGYNVLKCSNGPKGLNMLRYAPRDISAVLLDFDMPQLDGAETFKFIRQIAPTVKVGVVTGIEPHVLPHQFGADPHRLLLKPFAGEQLLEFVQTLLAPAPEAVAVAAER